MPLFPFRDRTISLTLESTDPKIPTKSTDPFVNRFLPNRGIGGFITRRTKTSVNDTVILRGPISHMTDMSADIGSDPGISTSFIQPWFIKNIPITIEGESYLGAYTGVSVPDRDVERLLRQFRESLNDFSDKLGSKGSQRRVLLEIRGGPPGTRRFLGYIKTLRFGENIQNPYFLRYTLQFLGRSVDNVKITQGKTGASGDLRRGGVTV